MQGPMKVEYDQLGRLHILVALHVCNFYPLEETKAKALGDALWE